MPCRASWTIVALAAAFGVAVASAQTTSIWVSRDHPAIQYSTRPTRDAIVKLNESLEKGSVTLEFDSLPRGYLASVLKALDIPVSSQTLVFSENSLQRSHISKDTPRAVYFNDTVAVSWAKGADTVESIAFDRAQGIQFYSLRQQRQAQPQFVRRGDCLQCHLLPETHGVPGVLTMSVLPLSDNKNEYAQGWAVDHRTPIEDRWGGWYVTGAQVPLKHLGNVPVLHVPRSYVRAAAAPKLATGSEAFDAAAYLTPHSDVVALMVLNHQTHMTNLLTRLGWQARIAAHDGPKAGALSAQMRDTAFELVDYLLFVDEAPMPSAGEGRVRLYDRVSVKRPARQEGAFAARPGSHAASASLSLQLHDLQRSVRRAALRGKRARLRAHVGNLVRCGQRRGLLETLARGPPSHRRNPARHQERPSLISSREPQKP